MSPLSGQAVWLLLYNLRECYFVMSALDSKNVTLCLCRQKKRKTHTYSRAAVLPQISGDRSYETVYYVTRRLLLTLTLCPPPQRASFRGHWGGLSPLNKHCSGGPQGALLTFPLMTEQFEEEAALADLRFLPFFFDRTN